MSTVAPPKGKPRNPASEIASKPGEPQSQPLTTVITIASTINRRATFPSRSVSGWAQKTRATTEARSKKGRFYKPLPKEFRHDGFTYRQIAREGDAAIYEQRWTGCAEPSVCYEVIRIRRREGFQIGGRFVEPAEVYPNSEAWGAYGVTFTDKDRAFVKLHGLRGRMQRFPAAGHLNNERSGS